MSKLLLTAATALFTALLATSAAAETVTYVLQTPGVT